MFPHCRWSNDRFECKYKKLKKSTQLCLKPARKQITWLSFLLRFVAITNLLPGYPVLSKNYKRGDRVSNGNRQVIWTLSWIFGQSQFFQVVFIPRVPFLFVDVGGQRTQRQKWFQVFFMTNIPQHAAIVS